MYSYTLEDHDPGINALWKYKNDQDTDPFEILNKDDEVFIYDSRDPEYDTTRWVSIDEEHIRDLEYMR